MIVPEKGRTVYFIGIGGVIMTQAALLVKEMGYQVRGSDTAIYPPTDQLLKDGGISVAKGYDATHLNPGPDLVVIGNAVSRGNPEVEAVLDEGIPFCSLPELIRDVLLWGRRAAVVAGTHGKTTTASLLAWLLFKGGVDPSFLIGGVPLNFGRGSRFGTGDWVVLEGDEYDSAFFDKRAKFLHYLPRMVVLNNIEYDHADIYRDLEEIKISFRRLLAIVPRTGVVVACADDEIVREIIFGAPCPVETFGSTGTWSPKGMKATTEGTFFSLTRGDEDIGEFSIPLWGEHNIRNAVGTVVASHCIGLSLSEIREGLRTFQGVRRRMEVIGEIQGITVIDDFAHHPTAVRETLRAVRSRFPKGRLWCIFEPRTHTMRRGVMQGELAAALGEADRVVIGKVSANSIHGMGLDPHRVVDDINRAKGGTAVYREDPVQIVAHCVSGVQPGDVMVVMSSGHFDGVAERISKALRDRS